MFVKEKKKEEQQEPVHKKVDLHRHKKSELKRGDDAADNRVFMCFDFLHACVFQKMVVSVCRANVWKNELCFGAFVFSSSLSSDGAVYQTHDKLAHAQQPGIQ